MSDESPPLNEDPASAAAGEEAAREPVTQQPVPYVARPPETGSLLRSFTRLLVGGTLVAWDELTTQLRAWEGKTQAIHASELEGEGIIAYRSEETPSSEQLTRPPVATGRSEGSNTEAVDVLLGLLFESQSRFLERSRTAYHLADQTTGRIVTPVLRRMGNSRFFRPGRRRLNALANRGEDVVERWAERGRAEEAYSRRLFLTAVSEAFGTSMDQLAEAPQLQTLVRKQSAGLSQEVMDEVRERTVSGDLLVEHIARSLLRRAPRRRLPLPPTAQKSVMASQPAETEEG